MMHRLRAAFEWHRPLMIVGALMGACAVVSVAGLALDPREILGASAWAEAAEVLTLDPRLRRHLGLAHRTPPSLASNRARPRYRHRVGARRRADPHRVGSGDRHHQPLQRLERPAHGRLGEAVAISVMYLCTFATSVALIFLRLPDPAVTLGVRAGAAIALIGIGVAFLMTAPTGTQLTEPTGIAGAHAVGVADGGPGVPLLGWSTVGGDYRVAHFVGMHALQLVPIAALVTVALGTRVEWLASSRVQVRLVAAGAVSYAATVVLLTVQAAAERSVAHPSGFILVAGVTIAVCTAAGALFIVLKDHHSEHAVDSSSTTSERPGFAAFHIGSKYQPVALAS